MLVTFTAMAIAVPMHGRSCFWSPGCYWSPGRWYEHRLSFLQVCLITAGGAWDNAKKYVERGHYGGKKSECHKATVVGDTVGDPFKDTSGPALNILIKLMSMVSVVLAGLTVAWSIF